MNKTHDYIQAAAVLMLSGCYAVTTVQTDAVSQVRLVTTTNTASNLKPLRMTFITPNHRNVLDEIITEFPYLIFRVNKLVIMD